MKLTKALREWLIKEMSVKTDASDDEFRKAAGEAFAGGKLTAQLYADMTKDARAEEANQVMARLDRVGDGLEKLTTLLSAKQEQKPAKCPECGEELDEDGNCPNPKCGKAKGKAAKAGEPEGTKDVKLGEAKIVKPVSKLARMFSLGGSVEDGDTDIDMRVKQAAEMYSTTKSALVFPSQTKAGRPCAMAGMPVRDFPGEGGRDLDHPSERDKALVGAWAKFLCASSQKHSRNLAWMSMPAHDRELILWAMDNEKWCGATDGGMFSDINARRLSPHEQKALIDDSTSGGIEAVPLPFDDMIITAPILNGELFPLVEQVPLDKGRRIQGAAAGTVTSEWGGVDDTAVTLFDTTSYISAFDTTIYRWQGSIWIGLDFLSDTPIDFAMLITQQYGEVLLQELDSVVAVGNGTTQPEGVMTKSGVASSAWGAATSIGNYESLRFGVHKREHLPNLMRTAVFCGTDTSYQRAMAIPVGASDARRLSQTQTMPSYDGYSWMGRAYKINESLSNAQIFYAVLGRYRMYRRRGLTIKSSTEGDTLLRRNEMLMVATARYGGQLTRAACAAKTTTAPT